LKLSNPSKLVISKKWKSRIALLVNNDQGLFLNGFSRQKPARLAFPTPDPVWKNPVGFFEQNETPTNLEC